MCKWNSKFCINLELKPIQIRGAARWRCVTNTPRIFHEYSYKLRTPRECPKRPLYLPAHFFWWMRRLWNGVKALFWIPALETYRKPASGLRYPHESTSPSWDRPMSRHKAHRQLLFRLEKVEYVRNWGRDPNPNSSWRYRWSQEAICRMQFLAERIRQ